MKKWLWVLVLMAGLLGAAALVSPSFLGLVYQARGGRLIAEVMTAYLGNDETDPPCAYPALTDPAALTQVTQAIDQLQKALRHAPQLSQGNLWLGRAYCLTGDTPRAIAAYARYTELRPQNPLGHLELALAYDRLCSSTDNSQFAEPEETCLFDAVNRQALAEWEAAQVGYHDFIARAEEAFTAQAYAQVLVWLERAWAVRPEFSPESAFKWAVSAAMTSADLSRSSRLAAIEAPIANDRRRIEAESMQWVWAEKGAAISPGNRLNSGKGQTTPVGVFWWNGVAAAIVHIPEAGQYTLRVRALDAAPAPIEFALERDFTPLQTFSLSQGDGSWQVVAMEAFFEAGWHVLGVRFLNNGTIDGQDRNLVIDWIEIQPR